jgi:hypothetical protein
MHGSLLEVLPQEQIIQGQTCLAVPKNCLAAPKVLETRRGQLCIAHRVLDVFVPEVSLQRPRVVASVRQRVATGVAQHVWMGFEGQLRPLACSLDLP